MRTATGPISFLGNASMSPRQFSSSTASLMARPENRVDGKRDLTARLQVLQVGMDAF